VDGYKKIKGARKGMFKLIWLMSFFISEAAFAVYQSHLSVGKVAENITEPIEVVSGFVSVGCLLVGVSCLFAAIVKYFEHRKSPLAVPMSTVVWLVIIGLVLLILPFAYMITENGIPFSAFWGG
jgi:hypothetical protein